MINSNCAWGHFTEDRRWTPITTDDYISSTWCFRRVLLLVADLKYTSRLSRLDLKAADFRRRQILVLEISDTNLSLWHYLGFAVEFVTPNWEVPWGNSIFTNVCTKFEWHQSVQAKFRYPTGGKYVNPPVKLGTKSSHFKGSQKFEIWVILVVIALIEDSGIGFGVKFRIDKYDIPIALVYEYLSKTLCVV